MNDGELGATLVVRHQSERDRILAGNPRLKRAVQLRTRYVVTFDDVLDGRALLGIFPPPRLYIDDAGDLFALLGKRATKLSHFDVLAVAIQGRSAS